MIQLRVTLMKFNQSFILGLRACCIRHLSPPRSSGIEIVEFTDQPTEKRCPDNVAHARGVIAAV
jgi:hypothetical protein